MLSVSVVNAIYGRFLLYNMSSQAATLITATLLGVLEVASRLTVKWRDTAAAFAVRNTYGKCRKSNKVLPIEETSTEERINEEVEQKYRNALLYSHFITAEMVLENMSIICSGFFLAYNNINVNGAKESVDTSELVANICIQLALEMVVDITCVFVEMWYFKVPVIQAWGYKTRMYVICFIFITYAWFQFFLGNVTRLLCWNYDNDTFYVYYCGTRE